MFQQSKEPDNTNLLNTNQDHGFYVCIKCGVKLYSSAQKKFSTKWPLFSPLDKETIISSLDIDNVRTEIKCGNCYAHLGHDLRFNGNEVILGKNKEGHCVDSFVLKFIPLLENEWRRYVGVLPYAVDELGECWLLLGQEATIIDWPPSGTWSCWGGGQERIILDSSNVSEKKISSKHLENHIFQWQLENLQKKVWKFLDVKMF